MATSAEVLKFDLRVRERLIQKKLLSEKELKEYLTRLPDLKNDCERVDVPQPIENSSDIEAEENDE